MGSRTDHPGGVKEEPAVLLDERPERLSSNRGLSSRFGLPIAAVTPNLDQAKCSIHKTAEMNIGTLYLEYGSHVLGKLSPWIPVFSNMFRSKGGTWRCRSAIAAGAAGMKVQRSRRTKGYFILSRNSIILRWGLLHLPSLIHWGMKIYLWLFPVNDPMGQHTGSHDVGDLLSMSS